MSQASISGRFMLGQVKHGSNVKLKRKSWPIAELSRYVANWQATGSNVANDSPDMILFTVSSIMTRPT